MILGRDCDYNKEALHLFVHSLGMYDEHVRPDRDKFVKVDLTKLNRK